MEELFLLAERIVYSMKNTISTELLNEDRYSFNESVIKGSSLSITFSNAEKVIIFNLSTHHLDRPWSVEIKIVQNEQQINFKTVIQNKKREEVVYEVYPNLLSDPNGLGNRLADEMANDLLNYLKNNEGNLVI